jgi:type IV pilus assembly protein PilA
MRTKGEKGFSLIELLVVVVVIGLIASIAVPHLQKALRAAENGNTEASLKSMGSTQTSFMGQHARYGRLGEINSLMSGAMGTVSGADLVRGRFVLSMVPPTPTDAELRLTYKVTATRDIVGEGVVYVYELTPAGVNYFTIP